MRFLIHIHGGESFRHREIYEKFLQTASVEIPSAPEKRTKKWRDRYEDIVPETIVIRPHMPCADNALYDHWALWFGKYISAIQGELIVVGHSLGATFLLQYMAQNTLPRHIALTQAHFVAPALSAGSFIVPADLSTISHQTESLYLYHSTDDPIVPYSDSEEIARRLPEAEFVSLTDRAHINQPDFPELFERLQSVGAGGKGCQQDK